MRLLEILRFGIGLIDTEKEVAHPFLMCYFFFHLLLTENVNFQNLNDDKRLEENSYYFLRNLFNNNLKKYSNFIFH